MTSPNPQPTLLSFLGLAKETTQGTAVTASTDYIPSTTVNAADKPLFVPDKGWRGSMVDSYDQIQGPISSELDFAGDVFADTYGYFVFGVLGDVKTTGTAAPFTHAGQVKNSSNGQPTSFTVNDNYVAANRYYAGCVMTETSVKFNAEGLLTHTSKALGWKSATQTKPTASYSAVRPSAAWIGTVTAAAGTQTNLETATLTIKRGDAKPIWAIKSNSQNPYFIWVGGLDVSGSFTAVMEDDTYVTNMLANTQSPLVFDFQSGAGATLVEVKFQMTKAAFTVAKAARGKTHVEVDVNFTAVANVTDGAVGNSGGYSPIAVTLQNAKAASTYQ